MPEELGLVEADRIRDVDPERALATYARAPQISLQDLSRLDWILQQGERHRVSAEVLRTLLRTALNSWGEQDPWEPRREKTLLLLAESEWTDGHLHQAGALWRRGIEAGRATRNALWVRCCFNLAMAWGRQSRWGQALILVSRARSATPFPARAEGAAYGAIRHAFILSELNDLDRARVELLAARPLIDNAAECHRFRLTTEWLSAWSSINRRAGDYLKAYEAADERIALLETGQRVSNAAKMSAHLARVLAAYEVFPDRRWDGLSELESLPQRFTVGPTWMQMWREERNRLFIRHALSCGNQEMAQTHIADQIAALRQSEHYFRVFALGRELAEFATSGLAHPHTLRDALDIALNASVRCIVATNEDHEELAELQNPSTEDRFSVRFSIDCLQSQQQQLLQLVTQYWSPGNPAYDLLTDREGYLVTCAWCQRIRTQNDAWIPVSEFVPDSPDIPISHGICSECTRSRWQRSP